MNLICKFLLPALFLALPGYTGKAAENSRPPNIVIIMADDLGYGDLSSYGHPTIRTPHLDRMASEGMRFTSFYSGAPVCTPSRAALLTGRYPLRSGMASEKRRVLFPNSRGGLPTGEITLAEALKETGYTTAAIGKWHLGHLPQYLPRRHGFDYYYGIPYSNDMDATADIPKGQPGPSSMNPQTNWWNVPLMRNEEIIERPANQYTLTKRYTEESIRFIRENKSKPFFLYLPHTMPHVPLFNSAEFKDHSRRGLYGDVVEEIDWSVGQILQALRDEGLDHNTFMFFTSDNGPWLTQRLAGGSAGLLRDGKGSTWEGGMRVPGIAWWPGKIKPAQVTTEIACLMDLFPTALRLANRPLPKDRPIDGQDISPLLLGQSTKGRESFFYYRDVTLTAARKGPYKAHFVTQGGYAPDRKSHNPPQLFHLDHDPSERFDIASQHPEIVSDLIHMVEEHLKTLSPVENQLEDSVPKPNSKIIQPSAEGSILLHSRDATIHGTTVRYEPQPNKNTIGYWTKVEDWVSWDFQVKTPGVYSVKILQGCGPGSGGSEVEFIAAGQTNTMTVQATKHFQDFIERDIGRFNFRKPGNYTLGVRPKSKPGVAVMDLRQVTLVPN